VLDADVFQAVPHLNHDDPYSGDYLEAVCLEDQVLLQIGGLVQTARLQHKHHASTPATQVRIVDALFSTVASYLHVYTY